MSVVVLAEMPDRLRSASSSVRDARERLSAEVERRNALVVEAVDAGMSGQRVARLVGVSQPHVVRILSHSDPEALAA